MAEATTGGNMASTVREILSNIGTTISEMAINERFEVDGGAFTDLTIEKIDDDKLSVAHYSELNGDLLSDPEVVLKEDDGDLVLVTFQQETGLSGEYEHEPTGIENAEIHAFVRRWAANLQNQGHVENAAQIDADPA